MPTPEIQSFFSWLQSHNAYIDTSAMDVIQFPPSEGGRGAVALKDIPEGHVVFAIPRSLILSPRTSVLPQKFGADAWKNAKLHEGWSGLILCMMWEAAQGSQSKWSAYFDVLPSTFDTPMFWNEEDLAELKGTSVVEKLGKDEAEKDHREKVVPAVQSRPDLFAPQDVATRYSLETYHLMGSRVLTRSFTLEKEEDEEKEQKETEDGGAEDAGNTSIGSAMDVDSPEPSQCAEANHPEQGHEHDVEHEEEHEETEQDNEDEEEEEEGAPEIALVPLADFLNARYKTDNVKLFCEPDCLKMISTKPITAGEQIWNTYGDRPNSELLRSYGHVDYLPLPGTGNAFGNPGDIVEIRADLVVGCALEAHPEVASAAGDVDGTMLERIDWWLEEGGDDVFVLEIDPDTPELDIPVIFLSFTRLILFQSEWERAKAKGKPPKPTPDARTLSVLSNVFTKRLEAYDTSLEDDDRVLAASLDALSLNKRHALIVRAGEKRILHAFKVKVESLLGDARAKEEAQARLEGANGMRNGKGKRKAEDREGGEKRKKQVR